jgi:SulP family sulfate permease
LSARSASTVIGRFRRLLPRRDDYADVRTTWRRDVVAGVTVGVVALPLALAFGITTGLGAEAGLVTAIVAGVVAAVFGGSNVQVSGPTGAMTVVLVPVVARHGADAVLVVGLLAGIALVLAALVGLGRLLAFIPWPVVEGFTVGIALIIFLQQVPAALGMPKPDTDHAALAAGQAVADAFGALDMAAVALVALVAAIMIVGPMLHRSLPASLLAVVVATAIAEIAGLDVERIGSLPSSLPAPSIPHISTGALGDLLGAALAVTFLAGIESLLSARVADGMTDSDRHDPDRELFGQGLANLASPLFGGMPATGAIARTAVNVRAGARSRLSSIVHSLLLLAVVLLAGGAVATIPLAVLAGVLMVTAVRMVEPHSVRAVVGATRSDALVFGLTAVATVALDLVVAVEIGVAVAVLLALRSIARSASWSRETIATVEHGEVDAETEASLLEEHILAYRIDGALFFGAAQRFLTELTAVSDVRVVILRLPDLQMLDATGAQALTEIVRELEGRRITVLIKGPRPEHVRALRSVGAIDALAHEEHLFDSFEDAVTHARLHVERRAAADADVRQ